MGFVWTILIGAAIGALASLVGWGGRHGYIVNAVLGSLGGLVTSYLGRDFAWNGPNDGAGPIGAVIGAVLAVAVWRAVAAHPSKQPSIERRSASASQDAITMSRQIALTAEFVEVETGKGADAPLP
jgi:uncharacterized membrane protein YeaQ/YmgE (transglycosylase-associated protein family)